VSSTVPPLNADLSQNELTWSIGGLILADQFQYGATVYTNYSGGTIKISLDAMMNGNYGVNPPNSTSPMSFEDGEPFLIGTIVMAKMSYNTVRHNGVLQATVNFTNGTAFPTLLQPDGNLVEFTFGPNDPNIPGGYVLQVIGSITAPALCAVNGNVSYVFDSGSCTKCDGITRLVLNYTGTGNLSEVSITGGVNFAVAGHQLTVTPGTGYNRLPGNIKLTVGSDEAQIQTSGSRPLDPGNIIGAFTVTSVSKIMIPCEAECEGISRLVLRYNGVGDPATVTVSCGAGATASGNLITILPTGTELADNTTVTIGGDAATISTSCSQPLEVGYVFGAYEVVAVDKIMSGGGGPVPSSGPVVGATVDLLDGEGNTHSTLTDENGNYVFFDVPISNIAVSLVVPLGYSAVTPTEVDLVCAPGDIATVDFVVRRCATQDMPRSHGFWKHQVACALDGKQKGVQVPVGELVQLFAQVHERFDKYFAVFVPVVTLEDLSKVLSISKGTMYEKARMQFAALVLNVVSNRLSTWQFISADHATVSQAITYVGGLLTDGVASNDELAKNIAELIVTGQTVGSGVIPLTIGQIAYSSPKHAGGGDMPAAIRNVSNYPNPFNPMTNITYELDREAPVTLAIYNVLGQKVRDLVRGEIQKGLNEVTWDGHDNGGRGLGSGIYFCRLMAGREVITHRIVLIR
jgi:hypothetical protein